MPPDTPVPATRESAATARHADGSLNPNCSDKLGAAHWSCIEYDGTGLWCDSCLLMAPTHG